MNNNFFSGLPKWTQTLHEANSDPSKYGLDDADVTGGGSSADTPASTSESSGTDNKYSLGDVNDNASDNSDPTDPTTSGTDPDSVMGSMDDSAGGNDGSGSLDTGDGTDPNAPTDDASTQPDNNSTSPLQILNLSDADKKLNNLRLFRQCKQLLANAENTKDKLNAKSMTATQQMLVDKLVINLDELHEDLTSYMTLKYSDSYETNVTAYLVYLQRYNIVLNMIRKINDLYKSSN